MNFTKDGFFIGFLQRSWKPITKQTRKTLPLALQLGRQEDKNIYASVGSMQVGTAEQRTAESASIQGFG